MKVRVIESCGRDPARLDVPTQHCRIVIFHPPTLLPPSLIRLLNYSGDPVVIQCEKNTRSEVLACAYWTQQYWTQQHDPIAIGQPSAHTGRTSQPCLSDVSHKGNTLVPVIFIPRPCLSRRQASLLRSPHLRLKSFLNFVLKSKLTCLAHMMSS